MKQGIISALVVMIALATGFRLAASDSDALQVPRSIQAGDRLSIRTGGSGQAVLYIAGPGQVLRRKVQRGETLVISPEDLHNAGHYVVALVGPSSSDPGSAEKTEFDVVSSRQPASLSFLAKPSRLPVNLPGGISGVAYVFDIFRNLVLQPLQVTFRLSDVAGTPQTQSAETRNGVAWVKMNSATKAGAARFEVSVDGVADKRVVQQVPGEPCNVRMSAQRTGQRVVLETEPVHDCTGNAVSDGTIVTFTETRNGRSEATVDVPLKRGIARTEMPALDGAVVSVATGVAMGNEIRLGGRP
ncbi:MAG TPA: hypothetical protein VHS34_09440 [Terriglobales bacterium]|nr:hypothetical protein [Terriglobales bacterium]